MFPAGVPGLALILLRLGVAGTLWEPTLQNGLPSLQRLLGLTTVCVLLLMGFATPVVGTIAVALQLACVFASLKLGALTTPEAFTAAVNGSFALSLALLGPGAFSIDARLFGRRVLTSS